jgi:hypothetical protein
VRVFVKRSGALLLVEVGGRRVKTENHDICLLYQA